ncbi:class I SAM-dependent methyltransferase [Solirubrobacter phytolaccae]|uniref:Class I SAM-dependent methyltransferase n=1 Tax=Solirubrobacter phytolaccae TaxID=1404360 RepID=A0A9X3SJD3_9ACTN|nr:class I SAM-dependent methyltransferase [Solirubrobacter phytolaccae]MDA0185147.1 class I SAM-dependent methyltransferase [Solirubrobacter phytolaccae]
MSLIPEPYATQLKRRLFRTPDFYRLHPSGPGPILDVGCGNAKYEGATGIDISADTQADIVADLNEFPYPLEDDTYAQILCQDVLEHVKEPLKFMAELHRVAKPGARIHIRTPHFSSVLAYGDATHEHIFSAMAIRTFEKSLFSHYLSTDLRVVDLRLDFWDPIRWIGVAALANRFQGPYESLFAFRFPAMNISAELEVLK